MQKIILLLGVALQCVNMKIAAGGLDRTVVFLFS
jgi:hypothetical protein